MESESAITDRARGTRRVARQTGSGPEPAAAPGPARPGWKSVLAAAGLYAVCAAAATYPHVRAMGSALPSGGDPPQHLWILQWYRSCLLAGRNPLFCPELQYPIGAPLGNFSPLHLQAVLYLPLSALGLGDVLAYNLIWWLGLTTTSLGTAVLAWYVLRSRSCTLLAGALAGLSGPLLLHAQGHLELIYLGALPVFLVGWLRLVDRPDRGRLLAAAGLYVLTVASAAYYALLAALPAAFYVIWSLLAAGRGRRGAWLRDRAGWFVGFLALVLPCLLVLFAGQLWAATHGYAMARSKVEFADFGCPWWSYLLPTPAHTLGTLVPGDPYTRAGYVGQGFDYLHEEGSYLGLVTLGLLLVAVASRPRIPRSGFWWSLLAVLVVLSLGAYLEIGGDRVELPALWLWREVPLFRLIRSPARFNLPAAVIAALLAAAGLKAVLDRLGVRQGAARVVIVAALLVLAVLDLRLPPRQPRPLAPVPAGFAAIARDNPAAAVLEVPVQSSAGDRTGLDRTYWQARHGLRTSAGYSGLLNVAFNQQVYSSSPFPVDRADFLVDPSRERLGLVVDTDAAAYAWLFLTTHGFTHVLSYRQLDPAVFPPEPRARLEAQLAGARIFEDAETVVYARDRLAVPTRPALLPVGEGWRPRIGQPGRASYTGLDRHGQLAAYSPDGSEELVFRLRAASVGVSRNVVLRTGNRELARWQVAPGAVTWYESPPFRLPDGRHELQLEADGVSAPGSSGEALDDARTPYSLRVESVVLGPESP